MSPSSTSDSPSHHDELRGRFLAFVLDRHPFAVDLAAEAFDTAIGRAELNHDLDSREWLEALRQPLRDYLEKSLRGQGITELPEPSPGVSARLRLAQAADRLVEAIDGFFQRELIQASLTRDDRRAILGGMMLTRAVDNRLKRFFLGGEVRDGERAFQGKGFRSLGQEAIYAACLRLRYGDEYRGDDGSWQGDVVAPLIRDTGAALAMNPHPEMVRAILGAQMAKAGSPMEGRDLHIGDLANGVLAPAAPLSISGLNAAGLGFAMALEGRGRVAVTFIGEGGSSLGEWHEAINLCAASHLPVVFCIQNNQTALSTPLTDQTAVRAFADKAIGYGIPGLTIDGTDPDAIAAAFTWAADRAREGLGPALIELVCMRMCGHAHHDDMLYLGREPAPSWEYPELQDNGYADPEAWAFWSTRDPLKTYTEKLLRDEVLTAEDIEVWQRDAEEIVETEAQAVIEAPWPDPATVGEGVFSDQPPARRAEVLAHRTVSDLPPGLPAVTAPTFDAAGTTFLDAVMLGVGDALRGDDRVFVYGEDVGGEYGNAFLLLRPLLQEFGDRIVNSPLTEAGTLGVCVGAALGGLKPIGEIQFNDFVATGFNQLVNNAAKIRYRWGASVPMVVRMPWGGLRSAGPYHSQNTESWFYRTPGLKIVAPSTPEDARALLAAAVADPDPVLFYEHIGLYREPRIKQQLDDSAPQPQPLGKAALWRAGDDLAIVSYGAYVHRAMAAAERLAAEGIEASVLDLRSLVPLDRQALLRLAVHCGKMLIVQEDTRTGSIGESLAAIVQEEAFEYLDAPIRVLGALDTPVPYAPTLERAFLVSDDEIDTAARLLVQY